MTKSGYKKQSLNQAGAIAAFVVAATAFSCSFRSGMTLIAFYGTGSKLTKVGSTQKQQLEQDYGKSKGRGAKQVLACSLVAVICSVWRRLVVGTDSRLYFITEASSGTRGLLLGNRLTLAYVAFFACCAGDTWASELGILSQTPPRLITQPWKQVPPGTNGGVSTIGLLASAAGGACMGLCHALFLMDGSSLAARMTELVALLVMGTLAGLGGSLLDSLLGATVQATYYDVEEDIIVKEPRATTENRGGIPLLSNEMVNVVSTIITAVLAAVWTKPFMNCASRFW